MKINLLKSDVYNKIAAGEVVEKPFNVVKELVENSIDAGASEIKIEIAGGGTELIKVTDNGCGIEKEEIANAFASHATSKIKNIEDLTSVLTLGFRGEALASIASVSKITLKTKTKEEDIGTQVQNDAGNIVSVIDVGCPTGTTFEVRDLFFNIPARKKFLKKERLEEADIIEYIERLMLSHPEISFSLKVNGKDIYNFAASSLENAIFTIYGKEVYNNLIKVDEKLAFFDKDDEQGMVLTGFVGKPKIAKGNKKDQTFFVNGRCIKNQTVQTAISRAFEAYLMKGKYPFYVLNLAIPTQMVDVNVHPTKQDIRFENSSMVFDFIYKSVSSSILKAVSINLDDALSSDNDIKLVDTRKKPSFAREFQNISIKDQEEPVFDLFKQAKDDNITAVASPSPVQVKMQAFEKCENSAAHQSYTETKVNEPKLNIELNDKPIFENYKIIGRVFDTYIIIEEGDKVHFLDQHALHERLLFDKFSKSIENINSLPKQQFLMPIIKTLTNEQTEIILKNQKALENIGLFFEEFGRNTFRIGEVPLMLQNLDIDRFLDDLFENSLMVSNLKSQDLIKDALATMACKAAIKAGTPITEDEIKTLLNEAKETSAVMQCPHGRPFVITYSKKDIEKWFKRIV